MVFSLIGRAAVRRHGKTYRPDPVSGCISRMMAMAWTDSGTR